MYVDKKEPLHVLIASGSSGEKSTTRVVLAHLGERLESLGCTIDFWDLGQDPLPLFDIDTVYSSEKYKEVSGRASKADVLVFGTPDYHGTISSNLKNLLDHLWMELAGKLIGSVVASHEKGLTVTDHMRTVARQCYAWSLPYGVSFQEKADVTYDQGIISEDLNARIEMMASDLSRYGQILSQLRNEGLEGEMPTFMARYRKK